MVEGAVFDLLRGALDTMISVAAPFVLAALTIGLLVSLIQAATQLQENALSFVPKMIAVGAILTLLGPWMLARLCRYGAATMETVVKVGTVRR